MTLKIEAFVEIGFDFEGTSLRFGKIGKDEKLTKDAYVVIQNPDKTKIVDVKTSSPHIKARMVGEPEKKNDQYRAKIAITAGPGLPIGKLQDRVTVTSNDPQNHEATLDVYGVVIDNVEVQPDSINFLVDDSRKFTNTKTQSISVVNYITESPLKIKDVIDSGNNLNIDVKTIDPGVRYLVLATIKDDAFGDKPLLTGDIKIVTDNKNYGEFDIKYSAKHVK